jgi:hypothetical protein
MNDLLNGSVASALFEKVLQRLARARRSTHGRVEPRARRVVNLERFALR